MRPCGFSNLPRFVAQAVTSVGSCRHFNATGGHASAGCHAPGRRGHVRLRLHLPHNVAIRHSREAELRGRCGPKRAWARGEGAVVKSPARALRTAPRLRKRLRKTRRSRRSTLATCAAALGSCARSYRDRSQIPNEQVVSSTARTFLAASAGCHAHGSAWACVRDGSSYRGGADPSPPTPLPQGARGAMLGAVLGFRHARWRLTAASAICSKAVRSTFPTALVGIWSSTMISSGAL